MREKMMWSQKADSFFCHCELSVCQQREHEIVKKTCFILAVMKSLPVWMSRKQRQLCWLEHCKTGKRHQGVPEEKRGCHLWWFLFNFTILCVKNCGNAYIAHLQNKKPTSLSINFNLHQKLVTSVTKFFIQTVYYFCPPFSPLKTTCH